MDRITQLQDGILSLLSLTHTSIDTLARRTPLKPTNDVYSAVQIEGPLTTNKDNTTDGEEVVLSPEEFDDLQAKLVREFVDRAKEVKVLVDTMPEKEDENEIESRIQSLEEDMKVANAEYIQAVEDAETIRQQIENVYKTTLNEVSSGLGKNLPVASTILETK